MCVCVCVCNSKKREVWVLVRLMSVSEVFGLAFVAVVFFSRRMSLYERRREQLDR